MRGACYDNKLISRYDKLLPINIIQRQAKKVASSASERERERDRASERGAGRGRERARERQLSCVVTRLRSLNTPRPVPD